MNFTNQYYLLIVVDKIIRDFDIVKNQNQKERLLKNIFNKIENTYIHQVLKDAKPALKFDKENNIGEDSYVNLEYVLVPTTTLGELITYEIEQVLKIDPDIIDWNDYYQEILFIEEYYYDIYNLWDDPETAIMHGFYTPEEAMHHGWFKDDIINFEDMPEKWQTKFNNASKTTGKK